MARSTATATAAPAPAVPPAAPAAPKRITSCGAYVKAHEGDAKFADRISGRVVTCKRLPMHKGDCRATLHEVKATTAKSPKRKVSGRSKPRVTRTDFAAALAADIEAGKVTPSAALAKFSAFVTRSAKPRASRKVIAAAETAAE